MTKSALSISALLFLLSLAGCGFQLRGTTEVPPGLSPVWIKAPPGSRVAGALSQTLASSGVAQAASAQQASTIIRILDEIQDERVTAVNSRGKIIGTELRYRVAFDATSSDGRTLAERQRIDVVRDYVHPDREVIAGTEEVALIRSDMVQDVADRLLRRLAARLRR